MDVYQKKLISRNKCLSLTSNKGNGNAELTDDELILTQNENYGIVDYLFSISNDSIESIMFDDEVIKGDSVFEKKISFSSKYKTFTVTFKNGFADPCKFKISYIEADVSLYDQKVSAQNKAECLNKMSLMCNKGIDLVNFYWGKSADSYAKTIIFLYGLNEDKKMFMQKFIVDGDVFYKSICGLAFGRYKYEIAQYDAKDNLIVSTDGSFALDNTIDKCMNLFSNKLDEVKEQVRASGRSVVRI